MNNLLIEDNKTGFISPTYIKWPTDTFLARRMILLGLKKAIIDESHESNDEAQS